MDKNQTIGLFLIGLLLLAYYFYMKPKYEQQYQQQQQNTQQTVEQADTSAAAVDTLSGQAIADTAVSSKEAELIAKYGGFGKQAVGEEEFITLKNDKIELKLVNKGARVYSVQVYGYKTHDGDPLILFYGDMNKFNLTFSVNRRPINSQDFYFKPVVNDTVVDASSETGVVTFRLNYSPESWIDFRYTLEPGSYLVKLDVIFHNMKDLIPPSTTFADLYWKTYMPPLERGDKWEYQNTDIYYKYYQSDVEFLSGRKDENEKEITTKLRWVSFKHQFFASVLIAYDYFDEAKLKMVRSSDPEFLKVMEANIEVPFRPLEQDTIKLAYYFGPNKYSILKNVKLKPDDKLMLERMIPLGKGIIRWINKFVIIPLFNILGKYFHNYGIIILLMTIIIKLILSPLTYKSYMSSAKMKALKPEIDKILAKIPENDQLKRQQAMMDLYKKAGVSPMGGCWPMLIQFPILIAMFRFFPASIELRQQSFLWVKDLSSYDAILTWNTKLPLIGDHLSLFALLMAIAMFISSRLNQTPTDDSNPTAKSMKFMMYLMPLLLFVWFNGYSAALSYYYFLSNLISIGQIYLIRKFMDEEKLLKQLQENVKKNKGKKSMSSWQQRLMEESKRRAEMQRKRRR